MLKLPVQRSCLQFIITAILAAGTFVISYSQQTSVLIDTSEYQPYPEGINTNLMIAASNGYTTEIHRLIKLGAEINSFDINGTTPLMFAVANMKYNAVVALLTYGPDTEFFSNYGETPLHLATKTDHLEIAEALIRKKADINIKDNFGATPLHYASIYNYLYITDMLIYYNASVNATTEDGTSPLMAAVWAGNIEIADMLIQNGADTDHSDNEGFTALHLAAQNGDTLMADLLLKNKAEISQKNSSDYDALSISIRNGHKDMTKYLLKKMSVTSNQSGSGIDPFSVARKYSRKEIIHILRDEGLEEKTGFSIDQVSLSAGIKFKLTDIYLGSAICFSEPLHKIRMTLGIDIKPGYTKILVKNSDNHFTQYLDKKYILSAGFGKEFIISENYYDGTLGIITDLNVGYMISEAYLGTYIKPENKFIIIPSVKLNYNIRSFNLFAGYEYMNSEYYKPGAHWLKAGISVNLYFDRVRAPIKNIRWY
ncbi:MAG: ankyrin repeat domain-containing protein [Bacteroidales bacterium]|nr:ankyrin repeat domain-containing protein [Bacteroidales bacterium]